jgi:hypothetical protein
MSSPPAAPAIPTGGTWSLRAGRPVCGCAPTQSCGILDHDFIDPQASWTAPARVIRNGEGAEFIITFFQPPGFTDAFFDEQTKLVDIELAKLKEILEEVS